MILGFALSACVFDSSTQAGGGGGATKPDAAPSMDATRFDADPLAIDAAPLVHYRQQLSFKYRPDSANLVEFPMLVILDSTRIDYDRVQDQGEDLRFTDASGNELPHEIEKWNEQGRSYVWVRAPLISIAGGDSVWMSYGSPTATDSQAPHSVWNSDFAAVWHLSEPSTDVTALASHIDSTAGANHMDHIGGTATESVTSLGGAQSFDGLDDRLEVASANFQAIGEAITLSARARPTAESNFYPHVVGAGSSGRHWQIFWNSGSGWVNRYRIDGYDYSNWTSTGTLQSWNSLASVFDGNRVRLYVDGIEVASDVVFFTDDALSALTTPIYIGSNPVLSPREFQGDIDEVRISKVARSAEWIYAEHLSSTDSLLVYGQPEIVAGSL